MKQLVSLSILFSLISCATTFQNFFNNDNSSQERNEKLMQEDFGVDKDVFDKFKENKTVVVEPKQKAKPKIKSEAPKEIKISKKKKIKIKKKVRTAIKPKIPKRKIIIPPKKISPYPEGYPEKLKKHDEVSKTFWKDFKPLLFKGESVTLNITYLGVSTGQITIKTLADTMIGDSNVYHINARVKTADFYSYLYEIDDMCDSYIRPENFTPLKFSLIQRESSQDIDDLQLFDLTKLKTYSLYKRVTKEKKKKKKTVKNIPMYFQDPLSVLYFIRGLPMEKGRKYVIPIVNQGKVEVLTAEMEAIETISTKIGKKEAFKVKIRTKHKGKTIKGGKMTFWFTTGAKRIFLKFDAKIKIGSVHGVIENYKE